MSLPQSILATLAYHDIFDYPLTAGEVSNYLIAKKAKRLLFEKELARLVKSKKIGESRSFYFLKNRQKIVDLRLQRQKYSKSKLKRAQFFASTLKIIPTIKLVAVSGALAMDNSHQKDDIDLVIVTSKEWLWTTRFLVNILLLPFRRKPSSAVILRLKTEESIRSFPSFRMTSRIANKACLNVFLDESDLEISPQNLYLAHEICQMKPLWDRDGTYARFIKANRWVRKFLPSWAPKSSRFTVHGSQKEKLSIVNRQLSIVENFLRNFQLWYMRPKITTEKIGEHQLFFNPANTGEWVMEEYQKRLKNLGIKM